MTCILLTVWHPDLAILFLMEPVNHVLDNNNFYSLNFRRTYSEIYSCTTIFHPPTPSVPLHVFHHFSLLFGCCCCLFYIDIMYLSGAVYVHPYLSIIFALFICHVSNITICLSFYYLSDPKKVLIHEDMC